MTDASRERRRKRRANKGPLLYDQFNKPLPRTDGQNAHRNAEEHPDQEHVGHRFRWDIAIWRILAISMLSPSLVIWRYSHHLAVWWVAVVLVVEILAKLGIGTRSISGAVGVVVLAAVVAWRVPPNEDETHGWLVPGQSDAPQIPCKGDSPSDRSVYLGDHVRHRLVADEDHGCVIGMAGREILGITQRDGKASVSAELYDRNGLLARIVDNEFELNSNELFRRRRPDLSTLKLEDRWGQEVLTVQFLNPNAFYVTGRFYYPGLGDLLVKPDGVWLGTNHLAPACTSGAGGCAVGWGQPPPR